MKKISFLFIFCSLLFLFCGKEEEKDYFPMGLGSIWRYSGDVVLITSSSTDTLQKMVIEMKAVKKDNLTSGLEVTEFVMTDTIKSKWPMETTYVEIETTYFRESDNYILSYDSKDDPEPDTFLSLPLEKDKTWRVNSSTTAKVLNEEEVRVPAGTFKAWKIEETEDTTPTYYWLSAGTGMVKMYKEEVTSEYRVVINIELTSANIK
jgi:hypothetical protein